MLKTMSTNKKFTLIILSVVTFMIIITFVFWGIGPKDNQTTMVLAEIEGRKIALDEYWRAYDNEYRRLSESGQTKENIDQMNLKERVLDLLIDRAVLMEAAQRGGVKVSDKELQDDIMNTQYFQRNGVFDRNVYQRALSLNRVTPAQYENIRKGDLVIMKMTRLIGETTELTPDELKIINSLSGGNQAQLLEVFRSSKNNLSVQAYVEGFKKQLNIKVQRDLIS